MSGRHGSDRDGDEIDVAPDGVVFGDTTEKWWFNMATGAVEYGRLSPSVDRAGPFDTEAEASHAPETIEARARKWRSEEEEDRTR